MSREINNRRNTAECQDTVVACIFLVVWGSFTAYYLYIASEYGWWYPVPMKNGSYPVWAMFGLGLAFTILGISYVGWMVYKWLRTINQNADSEQQR